MMKIINHTHYKSIWEILKDVFIKKKIIDLELENVFKKFKDHSTSEHLFSNF